MAADCRRTCRPHRRQLPPQAAAAASTTTTGSSSPAAVPTSFHFVCPICLTTELQLRHSDAGPAGDLSCPRCARTFAKNATYADLTINSGVRQEVYQRREWQGTELFRSPLVSFAYERGWRQGFTWAGFPGACL